MASLSLAPVNRTTALRLATLVCIPTFAAVVVSGGAAEVSAI